MFYLTQKVVIHSTNDCSLNNKQGSIKGKVDHPEFDSDEFYIVGFDFMVKGQYAIVISSKYISPLH